MADTIGSMQLDAIKAPLFREVKKGEVRKHLITLTVRNELGVLARIATLIAGKGYNIEGLSVGETHEKGISRMTLEVIGDDVVIDQVVKQLRKLIDTIKVKDLLPQTPQGTWPLLWLRRTFLPSSKHHPHPSLSSPLAFCHPWVASTSSHR